MAQTRKYNYKQPITSFDWSTMFAGILPPGRYGGFDSINPSGLDFDLTHALTGPRFTKQDLSQTDKLGVMITPQNQIVQEDEEISLTATTNTGNASARHDLIIFEHEYVASIGGVDGTYSILEGPNGSATPPALTNPEKQIILGTLVIPANASNLSGAVYTPAEVPNVGNANIITNNPLLSATFAKLAEINAWTIRQAFPATTGSNLASLFGTLSAGKWTPNASGNAFSYPSGSPTNTINEIQATTNNAELIVYNFSNNPLTFTIGGTPSAGGLSMICGYTSGSIVVPTQGWIHLRQLGGVVYNILADSTTLKDSIVHLAEWNSYKAAWTELALTHDQALDDVGDWKYSGIAPTLITVNEAIIRYKLIGKTVHVHVSFGIQYDSLGAASLHIHTIKLPFSAKKAIRQTIRVFEDANAGAASQDSEMTISTNSDELVLYHNLPSPATTPIIITNYIFTMEIA